jgi:hypothetical protein
MRPKARVLVLIGVLPSIDVGMGVCVMCTVMETMVVRNASPVRSAPAQLQAYDNSSCYMLVWCSMHTRNTAMTDITPTGRAKFSDDTWWRLRWRTYALERPYEK